MIDSRSRATEASLSECETLRAGGTLTAGPPVVRQRRSPMPTDDRQRPEGLSLARRPVTEGATVGSFTLCELLGQGDMGSV